VAIGWYKESHRHSLASRGIKTNYYAEKRDWKGMADSVRSFFGDGKPQTENYAVTVKSRRIQSLLGEVMRELNKAEREGRISAEDSDKFITDVFRKEEQDYRDNTVDYARFKDAVLRRLEGYKSSESRSMGAFSWAKPEQAKTREVEVDDGEGC